MAKSVRISSTDSPAPLPPRRAKCDGGRFTITMQLMRSGRLRLALPIRIAYLASDELDELIIQLQRVRAEL